MFSFVASKFNRVRNNDSGETLHVSGPDWIFSEIMTEAAVTSTGGVCRRSGSEWMWRCSEISGCPLALGAHSWPPSTESRMIYSQKRDPCMTLYWCSHYVFFLAFFICVCVCYSTLIHPVPYPLSMPFLSLLDKMRAT